MRKVLADSKEDSPYCGILDIPVWIKSIFRQSTMDYKLLYDFLVNF